MNIRSAVPADLKQCVALDHNYPTERVWQMNRREENGAVMLSFHTVRLPRAMRVFYPRDPGQIWESWRSWDALFVAEEEGYIHGYSSLVVQAAESRGWIQDLVVNRPLRRKGIGTMLLRKIIQWAPERNLRQLTIEMQSKNFPGISFAKKHGFRFCGFDENYYPSRDIALFFSLKLR